MNRSTDRDLTLAHIADFLFVVSALPEASYDSSWIYDSIAGMMRYAALQAEELNDGASALGIYPGSSIDDQEESGTETVAERNESGTER